MAKRTKKTLVGLDIDATGVVAASVAINGRVRLERVAIAPLEAGVIRDGEVVDVEGLATVLRTLYRENKGLDKRVRVGLANQKIVVRVVELPYLEDPSDLEVALRLHAQDQLPMPVHHTLIDHKALDVVTGDAGKRQRVLLVAARREMVERMLSALRGAGLKPAGIDLSAFAMVRALYRGGAGDEQVLYMAVGGLTNLAVARGPSCLFARASGGGTETLAVELAERGTLTLEHARGWLEHVGLQAPIEEVDGEPENEETARQNHDDSVPHRGRGPQLARLPPHAGRLTSASRARSSPVPRPRSRASPGRSRPSCRCRSSRAVVTVPKSMSPAAPRWPRAWPCSRPWHEGRQPYPGRRAAGRHRLRRRRSSSWRPAPAW
jgi:type IV pilus assembly protein PilM